MGKHKITREDMVIKIEANKIVQLNNGVKEIQTVIITTDNEGHFFVMDSSKAKNFRIGDIIKVSFEE